MPVSPAPAATGLDAARWRNGFAAFDAGFYTPLAPMPLPDPYWVGTSARVAELMHLPAQWMQSEDALQALQQRFAAKLGLSELLDSDLASIENILKLMADGRVDSAIFWRRLSECVAGGDPEPVRDLFVDRAAIDLWLQRYLERCAGQDRAAAGRSMRQINPRYVLRNHLGEQAIRSAQNQDFSEVARLLQLLDDPFDTHPGHDAYAGFPPDWASDIAISCSS